VLFLTGIVCQACSLEVQLNQCNPPEMLWPDSSENFYSMPDNIADELLCNQEDSSLLLHSVNRFKRIVEEKGAVCFRSSKFESTPLLSQVTREIFFNENISIYFKLIECIKNKNNNEKEYYSETVLYFTTVQNIYDDLVKNFLENEEIKNKSLNYTELLSLSNKYIVDQLKYNRIFYNQTTFFNTLRKQDSDIADKLIIPEKNSSLISELKTSFLNEITNFIIIDGTSSYIDPTSYIKYNIMPFFTQIWSNSEENIDSKEWIQAIINACKISSKKNYSKYSHSTLLRLIKKNLLTFLDCYKDIDENTTDVSWQKEITFLKEVLKELPDYIKEVVKEACNEQDKNLEGTIYELPYYIKSLMYANTNLEDIVRFFTEVLATEKSYIFVHYGLQGKIPKEIAQNLQQHNVCISRVSVRKKNESAYVTGFIVQTQDQFYSNLAEELLKTPHNDPTLKISTKEQLISHLNMRQNYYDFLYIDYLKLANILEKKAIDPSDNRLKELIGYLKDRNSHHISVLLKEIIETTEILLSNNAINTEEDIFDYLNHNCIIQKLQTIDIYFNSSNTVEIIMNTLKQTSISVKKTNEKKLEYIQKWFDEKMTSSNFQLSIGFKELLYNFLNSLFTYIRYVMPFDKIKYKQLLN
jgi:hypothetical protein